MEGEPRDQIIPGAPAPDLIRGGIEDVAFELALTYSGRCESAAAAGEPEALPSEADAIEALRRPLPPAVVLALLCRACGVAPPPLLSAAIERYALWPERWAEREAGHGPADEAPQP